MSVLWELDACTLAVHKVWYGRTLIRSSYQLHYELAQALLNGEPAQVPELMQLEPDQRDAKLAQLTGALEKLTHVARHLRAQRDRGGALELEGVEVRVYYNFFTVRLLQVRHTGTYHVTYIDI